MNFLTGLFNRGGDQIKAAGEGVGTALKDAGTAAQRIRSAITGEITPDVVLEIEKLATGIETISRSGQIEINKIEAASGSWFNSGWRPFIGWVGGLSLALYFIPQFIAANVFWIIQMIADGELHPFPVSPEGILELVIGLLGLGLLRSTEKNNGTANLH